MRVTCSIDDGHPSDLRSAELLARHGLRATFFVPGRNREGPPVLVPAAVRCLDAHFEIGSHTLDHCFLPPLAAAAARHQVEAGKRALEDQLGHGVPGFCYPGGHHGLRERALVEAAGFAYARSTRNLALLPGRDRWSMPTTVQFYPHGRAVVLRNYLSQPARAARAAACLRALGAAGWEARLRALAELASERGGAFHLWWHSRDLDELGLWPRLDALLSLLEQLSHPHERMTNGQFWSAAGASR
jgi:peptidoglycan/xylan/chitin deacetylase (PgdA/CDA1 family)